MTAEDTSRPEPQSVEPAFRSRRIFASVLALVPMWFFGLGFLWWPLIAFNELVRGRPRHRGSTGAVLFVVLATVLGISLLANLIGGSVAFGRVPGAALAVVIWISVAALAVRWNVPGARPRLMLALGSIGALQGAMSLVAALLHPSRLSIVPSVLGSLAGGSSDDTGVATWLTLNLAYDDFFGENPIVRSAGMMGSAAWAGGFSALALVGLAVHAGPVVHLVGGRRWVLVVLFTLNSASVFLSYTRLTWILAVIGLVAVLVARLARRGLGPHSHFVIIPGILMAIVIAIVAPPLDVTGLLTELDELRPDSSVSRLTSYAVGIDMATGGDIATQAFGFGAKPEVLGLPYGVGSESTFVSLLLRGGALGLMAFVASLVALLVACVLRGDWGGGLILVLLVAHSVVEDIDVGTLTPLFLVLVIAAPTTAMTLSSEPLSHPDRPHASRPQAYGIADSSRSSAQSR